MYYTILITMNIEHKPLQYTHTQKPRICRGSSWRVKSRGIRIRLVPTWLKCNYFIYYAHSSGYPWTTQKAIFLRYIYNITSSRRGIPDARACTRHRTWNFVSNLPSQCYLVCCLYTIVNAQVYRYIFILNTVMRPNRLHTSDTM